MARTFCRQEGFSLLEVVVASTILGLVLVGLNSVLVGYSKSRTKATNRVAAHNIASSILDEIQARQAIENSLASDTQGRQRTVYLPTPGITVSTYFYWCFPNFPTGDTHNSQGNLWNETNVPSNLSMARPNPGRLYSSGGVDLGPTALVSDPGVGFIARISVLGSDRSDLGLGSPGSAQNLREFINGFRTKGGTTYRDGEFLDTDFAMNTQTSSGWCYVLDTKNGYEIANFGSGTTSPLNTLRTKVVVVRVYDRDLYTSVAPASAFTGKPRVAESYALFSGQVKL